MTTHSSTGDSTPITTGTSLEGLFLLHFLQALTKLQESMAGDDSEKRWEWFSLQTEYVKRLIPDRERQAEIQQMIDVKEAEYKKNKTYTGEYTAGYMARLEVVTEVIIFLTNSLDLVHDDVIGAMTSKAAREAYKQDGLLETKGSVVDE